MIYALSPIWVTLLVITAIVGLSLAWRHLFPGRAAVVTLRRDLARKNEQIEMMRRSLDGANGLVETQYREVERLAKKTRRQKEALKRAGERVNRERQRVADIIGGINGFEAALLEHRDSVREIRVELEDEIADLKRCSATAHGKRCAHYGVRVPIFCEEHGGVARGAALPAQTSTQLPVMLVNASQISTLALAWTADGGSYHRYLYVGDDNNLEFLGESITLNAASLGIPAHRIYVETAGVGEAVADALDLQLKEAGRVTRLRLRKLKVEVLKAKLDAAKATLSLIASEVCTCSDLSQVCAGCCPEVAAREAVQRINEAEVLS